MKHTYLVTTAAVALLTGTVLAAAQGMQKQAPGGSMEGGSQGQMQREQSQDQPGQKGKQGTTGQAGDREQGKQGQKDQGKQSQKDQGKQGQKEQDKQGTTGQAGDREQGKQGQAKEKGKNGEAQKDQGKGATTGQGQPKQGQAKEGQAKEGQAKEGQSKNGQRPEAPQGQARQDGAGSVTLTAEQRTKVRETVLVKGPKVSSVNFTINVGVQVPRTVRVVEVDPVLIEYYPRYRGHFYFIVNDQIIIVDREYRIVAVINV